MKITIFILLIFSYSSFVMSQSKENFVPGEVMVQLTSKAVLPQLLFTYNLTNAHTISARFNIYLLKFNSKQMSNNLVIKMLSGEKTVINVQNNHIINLRENTERIPNDSLFSNQWSLLNTGQAGGTAGADIDAILAWDITTGGVTALGDTIVVAIVDGGSDLNNKDLDFWKNRNEIPNNNIDDDHNGYIDDYDGWNAYTHNGNIPLSVHGVHVSGIAGAIGNNGKGITGVNWNVKTLPVAGDSEYESIVVEALSYIFVVREKYDQTNGVQGAFVVADNCSFGVDNGQPVNFPIWEAMYDSLGQLGILSMGATANHHWDIDSVGDVPTGFTTDYMISVTNTTKRDELYPNAGYGTTTIDLGAPGTLILSLGLNNTFRYSSGTSMATPHVTGAAALLMAAADSAFIIRYKNNPAEGALMIKHYLLSGVDDIADLQGVTVSGGRLNIFNSINLLLDAPKLTTNFDTVHHSISMNSYAIDTLKITNSGGDTLRYSITILNQPTWFLLSQYQGAILGGDSDLIVMQFNSNNIDTGYYSCVINIDAEHIDGKHIPVTMHVQDNLGVTENDIIHYVQVFPNPTSSNVIFNFSVLITEKVKIEIYDQFGRAIFVDEKKINTGNGNFLWDVRGHSKGVYYYRLIVKGNSVSAGKIVKM